ncbi:DNA-methyltransferase [Arthrobacter pityocampae]|uniref:DNA-methyltransferase n=1 Tax=Arthrobacter pityocampae TaxID=547334 RepID=UPI003735E4DB
MKPYYEDETITLLHGDALEQASTLPDVSVDCIVTSPPYYGLRDYGSDGQYGIEETPTAYVETMRALFSELRRVLADDGTLWLNIGDSYSGGSRKGYADTGKAAGRIGSERPASGLPGKNLLGIPWRVAFALQDDGWILRNSIIWQKPNAMPESVKDRLSGRHENLFMFAKSQRYWFDIDPIREESILEATRGKFTKPRDQRPRNGAEPNGDTHYNMGFSPKGKNPGDVWSISTHAFPGAHFAVFPPELARRCIVAGCKPGGTVLDPFSGSGTTGLVAQQNGRKYVGIDISEDYLRLSLETRLQNGVLSFGGAA